jgi:hypothetical protein
LERITMIRKYMGLEDEPTINDVERRSLSLRDRAA